MAAGHKDTVRQAGKPYVRSGRSSLVKCHQHVGHRELKLGNAVISGDGRFHRRGRLGPGRKVGEHGEERTPSGQTRPDPIPVSLQ